MKSREQKLIGILGLWHLGCIYATSFAKMGFTVAGYDNKEVVNNLKKGIPPIFEPFLEENLKKYLSKNLSFSSSAQEIIKDKDYIFVTYDLPVDELDRVKTGIIKTTFRNLEKYISPKTTVVISSQVPIGTSRKLVNSLKKKSLTPKVIYFPENLRLGNAFETFLKPDRIILGSDDIKTMEQFKKDFKFNCPVITMGLESAEMSKHALNSYLASCISLSNELSDLSEKTNANMLDVVRALKLDKRVSEYAPINPGLGFAGGTLGRDIQILKKIGKEKKYQTKLLNAIYDVNKNRISLLFTKVLSFLPSLKNKNIGLLGLTYKPNTNTLRRSMALDLANKLTKKGCNIKAFDPSIKSNIDTYSFVKVQQNLESFFKDLDLVILMTDWQSFREINITEFSTLMKRKIIIDTKNFLDQDKYRKNGFTYKGIGI